MKSFRSHLSENSLYSTPAEKAEFLSDDKNVANAFLIAFIGLMGAINLGKNDSKIATRVKAYMKDDKKLRLSSINDENKWTYLTLENIQNFGMDKYFSN